MIEPMTRYLTSEAKQHQLVEWRRTLTDWRHAGRPEHETGWPDPSIIDWVERINAVPGVCTLQSCAGHRRGEYQEAGHLWLAFNSTTADAFHRRAFELATNPAIERVATCYHVDGREIVIIEFQGEERGALNASLDTILRFLVSLRSVS